MTVTIADLIVMALFAGIIAIGFIAGKRAYEGRMSPLTLAALCGLGAIQFCFNIISTLRDVLAYLHE